MVLRYDPANGAEFWRAISHLPGYPLGEEIPLRLMVFESDALYRMPEYLESLGVSPEQQLFLVMDQTPMLRGEDSLKPLMIQILRNAGFEVLIEELEPDSFGQVHTEMSRIESVKSRIEPGMGVISLGSGVVTDITKHACHLFDQENNSQIPYMAYQTANSVSAYTSNMAPVFVHGVKRTLPSRYPNGLVCDLETLRDAPREMTVAGVGDMLAIFTSLPDWYLANQLGMDDSYSELPRQLIGPLDTILEKSIESIRVPEVDGMETLAKLISLGGLVMSLSHATTPLSGYEHVISHVLDMINEKRNSALAQHGSQVAMATILACQAYEDFLENFNPSNLDMNSIYPTSERMENKITDTFLKIDPSGKAGRECWSDYQFKLNLWTKNNQKIREFLNDWDLIRKNLRKLTISANALIGILERIDAPVSFQDLGVDISDEDVQFAFLNSPLMRKRLTLGDVLIYFGWDRERLWEEFLAKNWI